MPPTTPVGLTSAEVESRRRRGQTNASAERPSRTIREILRANLLTRFNLMLGALLAVMLVVGPLQDALFGLVLVANAAIGVAQEVRAKRTLERLALLSAPRARVVRDGILADLARSDVVLDDTVVVGRGDQVVADGEVCASDGLEIDESLLTGESRPVSKGPGDFVMSGSFVVAGTGRYVTTAVGDAGYAHRLAASARRFTLVRSELVEGMNRVLRYITWAVVPVALLVTVSQLHANDSTDAALSGTVAALVGMIPQGLVLLTSVAFAAAAVSLAHRRVLVQQLPAVEALARVDVVCFDKTGTLTDGALTLDHVVALVPHAPVAEALGTLVDTDGATATLAAIGRSFGPAAGWSARRRVAFSSARGWSAVDVTDYGTWVIGSPEVILDADGPAVAMATELASSGARVVALARSSTAMTEDRLPAPLSPVALAVLSERLRPEAADTVRYFLDQGVALKVLSGDSPLTAGAVAALAGVPGADRPIDARGLGDDLGTLGAELEEHAVFGRVSPQQKRSMVAALQARGHTVAMTGDGVNDVLALKDADVGIALGSGAGATRAVAQIVLLDDRFAQIPLIVGHGRRVAANIERVANAFLTKTVWATTLALAAGALLLPYPFLPRHLTIIDTLTIGAPGFVLAFAPSQRRFISGFVTRVLRFAVPAGLVVATATFAAFASAHARGLPMIQQRTAALIVAFALSLYVLTLVARPLTRGRAALVVTIAAGFVALLPFAQIRSFCALEVSRGILLDSAWCAAGGVVALTLVCSRVLRERRKTTPTESGRLTSSSSTPA